MQRKPYRFALFGLLALALSVTVGLTAGAASAAKKKTKVGGTVDVTQPVNQQVPDATTTTNGVLAASINVGGKKFKGTKVRDVNATVQTTGDAANAALDLNARLTAPNGTTVWLWGNYFNPLFGQSIGPLTLDDESVNQLGGIPPAPRPTVLVSPYAGTAQPNCTSTHGPCTLSAFDNGPVTGTWTLRVVDIGAGDTSVLNSWRLTVAAGKAFKTK